MDGNFGQDLENLVNPQGLVDLFAEFLDDVQLAHRMHHEQFSKLILLIESGENELHSPEIRDAMVERL